MAEFIKLDKFADSRGWSLNDIYQEYFSKIKTSNTPYYDEVRDPMDFQINFSILHPGIVKAWHRHKFQDDYFCILNGMAQVGTFDAMSDGDLLVASSPQKFFIGEHNPGIVHIPAGEWHGLTAIGDKPCGLLYLVTKRYDSNIPDEERAPHDMFVPKDWWLPENK